MRNTIRTLALAATLAGAVTTAAAAQVDVAPLRSNTRGFNMGLFLGSNGLAVEDADGADAGYGGTVQLGYGFSQNASVFARGGVASMSPDGGGDNYTLGQFDLGLRYSFASPARQLRPYLEGAVSGRAVNFDLGGGDEIKARGVSYGLGGGVEYFLNPRLALQAGLSVAVGSLSEGKVNDSDWVDLDEESINLSTARLDLGFIWHP